MAKTYSTMMPLGEAAPNFSLKDVVTGNMVTLIDVQKEKGLLVMFICRHCPFVVHVQEELARIGRDYAESNVGIVAISANDVENYPQDAEANLAKQAKEQNFVFPYCIDESQDTAKAYGAACTPDFFVFDGNLRLVYRGQLDDSRPGNSAPINGRDLRDALDALVANKPISSEQVPSIGCNIKWKPGNEPDYFG